MRPRGPPRCRTPRWTWCWTPCTPTPPRGPCRAGQSMRPCSLWVRAGRYEKSIKHAYSEHAMPDGEHVILDKLSINHKGTATETSCMHSMVCAPQAFHGVCSTGIPLYQPCLTNGTRKHCIALIPTLRRHQCTKRVCTVQFGGSVLPCGPH